MTLLDIFQDVARRCDKNVVSPDPETQARLRTFVNDRYRELLRLPGVLELRDDVFATADGYTFQSQPGENRVVLPDTVRAITTIINTTNRAELHKATLAWIRAHDPAHPGTASGTPTHYAVVNRDGVRDQPQGTPLPPALTIASSDLGDVGGVVTTEYQDQHGAFRALRHTLNGTTPVLLQGVLATLVFRIAVDGPQRGAIRLAEQATGTVLCTIPPNALEAQTTAPHTSRGWVLWLWPTPAGVYTFTVDGSKPRVALVDWMDEPALPEEFHTLLVWGACEDELLHMDDSRTAQYAERWKKDVASLRGYLHQARGQRLVPTGGRQRAGWTPMGGNFPPWQ